MFTCLMVGALLTSRPARAQSGPPPAAPIGDWYGWQNLIVDGASVVVGVGVGGLNAGAGVATFATGYTLGSPIVHLAHRRPLIALASLGVRLGTPLLFSLGGAIIGAAYTTEDDRDGNSIARGYLVGASVGCVAAIVIDDVLLAREPPLLTDAPPGGAPASAGFSWSPTFALARDARVGNAAASAGTGLRVVDGAIFGVRGAF